MSTDTPIRVHVTEVGARDGLQNERTIIPTEARVAFIEALVAAGTRQIEVGSFVHPRWVPAMADTDLIFKSLKREEGVRYLGLVPNMRGYDRALDVGCEAIAIFTAATEGFAAANINMSIAESLDVFRGLAARARADGVAMRGYISTVFACPYDGPTRPEQVLPIAEELLALGCYEVSLGDTIGVGTPAHVARLADVLLPKIPADRLVCHFHDTWGMGVANVVRALDCGFTRFDASAGGLGGCPFARSATGNVATEDVLYLLDALGHDSGYRLDAVMRAAQALARFLDHPLPSRVHKALESGAATAFGPKG